MGAYLREQAVIDAIILQELNPHYEELIQLSDQR